MGIGRTSTWTRFARASLVAGVVAAGCVSVAPTGAGAAPAPPELISVGTTGLGGNADSGNSIGSLDVSADGNIVVFDGYASDLVSSDGNGTVDVFVRDRAAGTTVLASVDSNEVQGAGYAYAAAVSADGRYVSFTTNSVLEAADTNGTLDIYVRDLVAGTTTRVSLTDGEGQLSGDGATASDISDNGRYVVFESGAPELVSPIGGISGYKGIFVRDILAGTTTRIDLAPDGTTQNDQGNPDYRSTGLGGMSPNGRYVVFNSTGNNLVPGGTQELCQGSSDPDGDPNTPPVVIQRSCMNVFVRDLATSVTTLASVDSAGNQADDTSAAASVSDQGDVAMWTFAANLGGSGSVVVHDLSDGTSTVIGQNNSNLPVISGDGRYVAFESGSTNGVAADTDSADDIFRFDRTNGTLVLATDGTETSEYVGNVALSDDGGTVAFISLASALLPAGSPTGVNIFVRDLGSSEPPPPPDDGDGIAEPPAGFPASYDGNGDGTPDAQQANVTSLLAAVGSQPVTIASPNGTTLSAVTATAVPGSPTPPPGATFPVGVLGFEVHLALTQTTADVEVHLPAGSSPNGYFKLRGGAWADFSSHVTIAGDVVTLHLVDNDEFDTNPAVGVIGDPGAPVVGYSFGGFLAPTRNKADSPKAGSTIPVQWRITKVGGAPVTDPASFVGLTSAPCAGGPSIPAVSSGASGLKHQGNGTWQLNWKTEKSYAGQCRTLTLLLADGLTGRTVGVRFK